MEADLVYYQRRTAEEAAAAEVAQHAHVRQAHLELARLYAERIGSLEAAHRRDALHLVGAS